MKYIPTKIGLTQTISDFEKETKQKFYINQKPDNIKFLRYCLILSTLIVFSMLVLF